MKTSHELLAELHTVSSKRVVGVGDNVLDCYIKESLCYPGGNALNIAAYNSLFFGGESGFVGIFGNDRFANHLRSTLSRIGVDHSRSRVVEGANGMAFVEVAEDKDRHFVGSNRGGVQAELNLRISPVDIEYLASFDVVHTSVYSAIESSLGDIAIGAKVSYDFSTDRSESTIDTIADFVDVAFFSGEGLSDSNVVALGEYAIDHGIDRAVITLGTRGAIAFEPNGSTRIGINETDVIDTLGAGDGFITGFTVARANGADLDECLRIASIAGAYACTSRGAFGFPITAGHDAMAQLINYQPSR